MEIEETEISGLFLINNFKSQDKRGIFVKTFHAKIFLEAGLNIDFKESYFSLSYKNVIRGMHFQLPPEDHAKLVYVTAGEILDVVVDLRKGSPTFKQWATFSLCQGGKSVYIPSGCAHGFLTLTESATVVYNVTSVYAPQADSGIKWNSIGFDWPVDNPVVSDRDEQFIALDNFSSPF